jgi:hypothetical protein
MAQETTVDKVWLLGKLNENRDKHRTVFEAAVEGYRRQAELELRERLDALRSGRLPRINLSLLYPTDHTRDYDRIILMVEQNVSETWTMDERDFAQYVMDDWAWKREFVRMSNRYAAGATQIAYGEFDEDQIA